MQINLPNYRDRHPCLAAIAEVAQPTFASPVELLYSATVGLRLRRYS